MDRETRRAQRRMYKMRRRAEKRAIKNPEPLESLDGLSGAELEAALRRRAEQRIRERQAFINTLTGFITVNALLWGIWFAAGVAKGTPDFPWPIFVTISWAWASGLISQGIHVYQNAPRRVIRHEEQIQLEVERERARFGLATVDKRKNDEKPKRDPVVRLSDDGELIYEDDDIAQKRSDNTQD